MKKILLLLLFPIYMIAQEASTTEDEYAYLTKGIRDQYTNGLDIKKEGYTLEMFFEKKLSENSDGVYTFYKFINSTGEIKAISVIKKFSNSKASSGLYFCIPINNEKLFNKFHKLAKDNFSDKTIMAGLSEAMILHFDKKVKD